MYVKINLKAVFLIQNNVLLFLKRIEEDECSIGDFKKLFLQNQEEDDYKPSLYVDFDKKLFYSMYIEPASYEDYAPVGWNAKCRKVLLGKIKLLGGLTE